MFLLDDLLLAPGKGAYALFQELARKAQDEWLNDDTIKQELQQLNELLEGGSLSEKEFEAKECRLLERLEQIARIKFQDKWGAETAVVEPAVEPAALPPADPVVLPPAPPPGPPPVLATPPPQFQMLPPPMTPPPPMPAPVWPSPPPMPSPMASPPPMPAPVWPPPPPMPAPAPPVWSSPPPMLSPPPLPGTALTMGQIIDCAVRAVSIMKMRVSSITAAVPDETGWRVSIELVERRGVPDTSDVLGLYEVRVDAAGNVLRYERTQMRRRGDFAR